MSKKNKKLVGLMTLAELRAVPKAVPPVGWGLDCLPTSGCLRLFCNHGLAVGLPLSSFEIFADI